MIKLCVIGNSHVAAIRDAWEKVAARYPNLDAEIFAHHAKHMVNAERLENGAIGVAGQKFWRFKLGSEADRCDAVDPAQYDATVLIGLGFGARSVIKQYRKYHYFGLKGRRPQGLTRDNFKKAAWADTRETAAMSVAGLVRQSTTAPIFIVPSPLPSEDGFADREKAGMLPWHLTVENGDTEALMTMYGEICDEITRSGITIVSQPDDTKAKPHATQRSFAQNASRTLNDEVRPENDYAHMNDGYGAIIWREIAAALRRAGLAA